MDTLRAIEIRHPGVLGWAWLAILLVLAACNNGSGGDGGGGGGGPAY